MTLMPHSWFFILFSILFAKHLWCHCTKDHCIVEWIAGTAVLHVGEKNRILEATGRTDCCGDITKKWKKNNKERGLSWRLLNYVTLVTSQDPDVSLEQAAVWMDWSFIDSDTGSGWVLSQQRLGTLELGPERPVGTLPWCQNSEGGGGAQLNMNTAHWRTGDPLRAERYEMLFLVWRKSEVEICHLWCEAVLFVQSPVNKTVWAGLFFSVFVQVRYPARLALQEHLFWQDWSVSVAPSIQKLLKSNVSSDL